MIKKADKDRNQKREWKIIGREKHREGGRGQDREREREREDKRENEGRDT